MIKPAVGADDERLLEWLGISGTPKKALGEVTYFTCLKMLSGTLGKMPIKFYQQTERGIVQSVKDAPKPTNDTNDILGNGGKQPEPLWKCICMDPKGI